MNEYWTSFVLCRIVTGIDSDTISKFMSKTENKKKKDWKLQGCVDCGMYIYKKNEWKKCTE